MDTPIKDWNATGAGWWCDYNGTGYHNGPIDSILYWGGDNQTSGAETVYTNINTLKSRSGLATVSHMYIYGNWYTSKGTGNVTILMQAYSGGTMSKSGTVYTNTGGSLMYSSTFVKNVTSQYKPGGPLQVYCALAGSMEDKYTYVGQVSYNKTTGIVTISM